MIDILLGLCFRCFLNFSEYIAKEGNEQFWAFVNDVARLKVSDVKSGEWEHLTLAQVPRVIVCCRIICF